jgi:hypothetical protein
VRSITSGCIADHFCDITLFEAFGPAPVLPALL